MFVLKKLFPNKFGKKTPCPDRGGCMNTKCKGSPKGPYYDIDNIYFSPSRGLLCPVVTPPKKSICPCMRKSVKCKNRKKDKDPTKEDFCSNEECSLNPASTLLNVPMRSFTFSPSRGLMPPKVSLVEDIKSTACPPPPVPEDEEEAASGTESKKEPPKKTPEKKEPPKATKK